MGKFATGLIAGSALGVLGVVLASTDRKTRKRMLKDTKYAIHKIGH